MSNNTQGNNTQNNEKNSNNPVGNTPNGSTTKINPKKLRFISIYFLGINGIIGSGAFLLPNQIYQRIGVASILVLLCAALTVSMIALCYADLSSRFSGSGAAWLYAYNAFGKFTGFQIGLYSWILGCLTLAAESVALVQTLKNIFPIFEKDLVRYLFPVCFIVLLCIINLFGTSFVKKVDNLSSTFKILTIIFFICFGIFVMKKANFHPVVPAAVTDAGSFIRHFGSAFSVVFYMFTGFSFIPVAAGQMNHPEKNIPKALITVMVSVTILYCLVQTIVIGILGHSIVKYNTPVAEAMKKGIGEWAFILIIIGMIIAIAGVAFAVSFSTPILAASLANEHKLFPKFMGKKNKKNAPISAIIVTGILGIALTKFDYIFLVGLIVLASFIQYVTSILAFVKFKKRKEFPTDGFRLKGGYTVPILAFIITLYLLTNFNLKTFILILAVFIVGTVIYFLSVKKNLEEAEKLNGKNKLF